MPSKMIFTTIATVVIATSALSATAFARGGAGHAGGFGGAHVGGFGGAHFGGARMGVGHIGGAHMGADHVPGMHLGGIARGPAGERVAHNLGHHFHRRDGFYGYVDGGLGDCSWPEYAQSNPWYCSAY
jgi:hypothetical protein